jgi:cobalt-zinc-cadmium efflux system membrane fusion protein
MLNKSTRSRCLLVATMIFLVSFSLFGAAPPSSTGTDESMELYFPPGSPQLANLVIQPVVEVPEPVMEPLNGKIAFDENHTARVRSPVTGRALRIDAEIGDRVSAGQVLVELDSPDVGGAIAEYRKAQVDFNLKKKARDRARLLFENGVVARKALEEAESDFSQAQAEVERTKLHLNNLGVTEKMLSSGENFMLRAPIAGIVVDRDINPGSEVRPDAQEPLFVITDPNSLWAVIDLPERDLSLVHEGQAMLVEADAFPGEQFSGRVLTVSEVVDPLTRRVQVRCSVDGKGKLRPQMYARVTLLAEGNRQVIRVPNAALITQGLYSWVFIETRPGHFEKRRVELTRQGREYSIVKDGLKAGERLVTAGALLLSSELTGGQ